MALIIRPLEPADRAQWQEAFAGFWAHFERELETDLYDLTFQRLFDPAENMLAIGAFESTGLVGFAHVVAHRSFSADGRDYYLQHLFVAPEMRRGGIGRALIQYLYAFVEKEGGHRIYWNVPADNAPALKLYDSLASDIGFRLYRKEFLKPR